MTTPDIAMPVSFTLVRQAGSDQLMRADGGEHYRLEGPSLVAASWSGPQKAEIWHQHKTAVGWRWRKLTEFNGGGEPQSGSAQKPGNQSWSMSGLLRQLKTWRKTTGAHSRSIRSSVWGGGVNDGTTRGRLDALAGHQACHDGRQHTRRDSGRTWTERHRHRFLATRRGAPADLGLRRGQVDVDLQRVPNPLRDERTTQGAHHPSHHGQAGDGATVRFHGGPVDADIAGRDDFPGPSVLATASRGGR